MPALTQWLGSLSINRQVAKAYKYWGQHDYSSTEKICAQILTKTENPDAYFLLAEVQYKRNENNLSLANYNKALSLNPNSAEFYIGRGALLRSMGKPNESLEDLRQAQTLDPDDARIYTNIALLYMDLGQLNKAEHHLKSAIALQPDLASAHCNLGLIRQWSGQETSAIEHFRKAISSKPDLYEAYQNLILALGENGEFAEAMNLGNQAREIFPDNPDLYNTLGTVLRYQGELETASELFLQALELSPGHSDAITGQGMVYRDLRDYKNAEHCFRHVIEHDPENAEARLNLSFLWLLQGDFKRGWLEYEQRYNTREAPLLLKYPLWKGESLDGRNLLITSEQGLGDEIMFASCLPDVISQAKHCTIECDSRLASIYSRSFPTATVIGSNRSKNTALAKNIGDIDIQIPVGSLSLYLRQTRLDFPSRQGYLHANPQLSEQWKERLNSLGKGLKIGISWKGGLIKTRAISRSIPLQQWMPVIQTTSAHFVNLQYDDSHEVRSFNKTTDLEIHSWKEALEDLDETAALIQSLDLVISVQTAVVHLAGALGKHVWALIPYSPEWRYLSTGNTLPWYPSVHLFRQEQPGEWGLVINEISKKLTTLPRKSQDSEQDICLPS